MQKKKILYISLLSLTIIIIAWYAVIQVKTIQTKDFEIVKMKETMKELEAELNTVKQELIKKDEEISNVFNNQNDNNIVREDIFDLLYIKVDEKMVSTNYQLINEYGLNLNTFCSEIWPGMKLEILEYSKKTFSGFKGAEIPTKFKISLNRKSIEFEGIVYASAVNGEPIAEYKAGYFGEIKARFKSNIVFARVTCGCISRIA